MSRAKGQTQCAEYYAWYHARNRCHNPRAHNYRNYGGRGIVTCDRWRSDFFAFLADMGRRPNGYWLERKDNDGPYSPENCHWVDQVTQANNKRTNHTICVEGVTYTIAEASRRFGLPSPRLSKRIRMGWDPLKAVTQPSRGY